MITSCSPGWVKFCEHNLHDFVPNLSSCKSPTTMLGAMIKSYYAEHAKIDPKKIFVVSVMPCTAKKFEVTRPEMEVDGVGGKMKGGSEFGNGTAYGGDDGEGTGVEVRPGDEAQRFQRRW